MLALCIYSSKQPKVTTSTKSLTATPSWVLPKGEACPPAGAAADIWKQNCLLFPNTPVGSLTLEVHRTRSHTYPRLVGDPRVLQRPWCSRSLRYELPEGSLQSCKPEVTGGRPSKVYPGCTLKAVSQLCLWL